MVRCGAGHSNRPKVLDRLTLKEAGHNQHVGGNDAGDCPGRDDTKHEGNQAANCCFWRHSTIIVGRHPMKAAHTNKSGRHEKARTEAAAMIAAASAAADSDDRFILITMLQGRDCRCSIWIPGPQPTTRAFGRFAGAGAGAEELMVRKACRSG